MVALCLRLGIASEHSTVSNTRRRRCLLSVAQHRGAGQGGGRRLKDRAPAAQRHVDAANPGLVGIAAPGQELRWVQFCSQ
jgi:hypothetical protein